MAVQPGLQPQGLPAAEPFAEVVGDAAVIIDPLNVDSIADGIDKVVGDERLRSDLCARGLVQAGRFSWDRTAEIT